MNGWAPGIQIPFEIRTICHPNSFQLDFRSPLYNQINMKNTVTFRYLVLFGFLTFEIYEKNIFVSQVFIIFPLTMEN